MSNVPIRVVKVGGSLFDLPDLGARLLQWIGLQSPACNLLLAGGGRRVDQLRILHDQESSDERQVHWQAIELMGTSAEELAAMLPECERLTSLADPLRFGASGVAIFFATQWLHEVEPQIPGTKLCESWDVTSDSIAARVACCVSAAELVLLKSATAPTRDLPALAAQGYVDRRFPELAQGLPHVELVNLRAFPSEASTIIALTQREST